MADLQRPTLVERDIDQAITALKKGAYLLKYGRRGKPKFCPFRLSADESTLTWYYGKEEKQLELRQVSRIIPGQRTPIFQRYPRPEKEYQSFSLIYSDRSLDLICKDKDEAEVWFVGLKALISRGSYRKVRPEARSESVSSDSPRGRKISPSTFTTDQGQRNESLPQSRLGKAFADIVTYTATSKNNSLAETFTQSLSSLSAGTADNNGRSSGAETFRVSLSSAVSSSSQGSCPEDFDSLGDVFIWGEGTGDGVLGGGNANSRGSSSITIDSNIPKVLESTLVLDVRSVACGNRHAVLVTKQGEIYSWGEETGGRLGHGVEMDVPHPKLINGLSGMNIDMVACGEYHTCAVTSSGDLYIWGDGTRSSGLLGHGSEVGHWIPKKISCLMEDLQVSFVSCGPWHTAFVTSAGQLFTFGDGTFGALGHGDRNGTSIPREVDALKEFQTVRVACGLWHTAAIVDVTGKSSDPGSLGGSSSGKLFTWGDGDKGQLGHGDKETRLLPEGVASLEDVSFTQVACGHNLTVALTVSGQVYTTGSTEYGQLGNPEADGKTPTLVQGNIADSCVEEIACGSHHVAVLTSKSEVYTWGKGANGQLGHGDYVNRNTPTLVDLLNDKQVKNVVCGSSFTAVICPHRWVSSVDNSLCSGCRNPFNFRRKRHNCYNCGLVFCKACSSRKALKASLAPSTNKPYRVCDDCFTKLQKPIDALPVARVPRVKSGNIISKVLDLSDRERGSSRMQVHVSRLSSVDSFNLVETRTSKYSRELNDSRVFPFQDGNSQRESFSRPKSPTGSLGSPKNILSVSLPGSRMGSRATSPRPGRTSPLQPAIQANSPNVTATELFLNGAKHNNESLIQEVKYLKAQVEELVSKSQLLEAELEMKSRQLKEATSRAADEAEKNKAAKEVIISLTTQLKEMTERTTESHISSSNLDSNADQISNDPNRPSSGSSVTRASSKSESSDGSTTPNSSNDVKAQMPKTSPSSPKSECSDGSTTPISSNGTKAKMQKTERVIQDEPGVYITLVCLPGGGNELRRVRFSRKRFTEEQAEKWWAENGTRVCEKYLIKPAH